MRQVFLSKSGSILVEEVPAPSLGPGEVLVDVAYSVISTGTETSQVAESDLGSRIAHSLQLARLGAERLRSAGLQETLRKARVREGIKGPTGYSVAGTVRAVGDQVADIVPGMGVAAAGADYAHHAEIVAVPRNLVAPLPQGVSPRAGSFATVGAIALQGVRRAAPQVGETVVVVGLGLVGQIAVQLLGASGCRVIGVDPSPQRVELASRGPHGLAAGCGAEEAEIERVVLAATRGVGADAVLLCAGTSSSQPANTALRVVRQRGRVVVVGAVGMDLERGPFYRKEVEFTISCSYGPGRYDPSYEEGGLDYPVGFVRWTENRNLEAFLDLVARGGVDPESLIAGEHPLEDAPAAFASAKSGEVPGVAFVLRYPQPADSVLHTVERQRGVASKTEGAIGLALIGAGGFARSTLLPAIQSEAAFFLRAVVTKSGASAAQVAEEFRAARASTDAGEVLADPALDAVVISTRHDSHASLALAALRAGKHVFLEKPMGIHRDEVEELRKAALESDRVFSVGYNRRYAPLCVDLARALRGVPGSRSVVYRVNAGAIPPGHWTLDPDVGGGRIVGEACHMLDLLFFLLGPELVEWHAVAVPPQRAHEPSPQDFSVTLRFRDAEGQTHVASLLYTSQGSKDLPKERIELFAGGGAVVIEDFQSLTVNGLPLKSVRLRRPDKGNTAELGAFARAIRGEASDLLDVEGSARASLLALEIDAALRGNLG